MNPKRLKRPIRVYIAAPWVQKAAAKDAADLFEREGFVVTKPWWEHREVPGYLTSEIAGSGIAELVEQAVEDYDGVTSADAFVLLNFGVSEGKAVETGVAIAAGVPIVLVGPKSNLFHYWPGIEQTGSVLAAPMAVRELVNR